MRSLRDDILHEYSYDVVDRLTRWQRGPDRFEAYNYDAVGNRQQLEDERGTTTYSYDLANRLTEQVLDLTDAGTTTTNYQWDPNGNLLEEAVAGGSVTTYTWDTLNRLTALDGPTGLHSYGYDPNGIRVRETNGGDTTRFLHGGEDILATYQAGSLETYFTHGPGIDEPWAQARPGEPDPLAYLHRDGLGSVTAISSPEAQLHGTTSYAAFGQVEQTTGLQTRYGFTSRELDPTGLMYYRARYYQPEVGRFASADSFRGLRAQPASLNLYVYSWNRPISLIDPSGHAPLVLAGLAFLLVAGQFFRLTYLAHTQRVPELVPTLFSFGVAYAVAGLFLLTLHGFIRFPPETYQFLWSVTWGAKVVEYRVIVGILLCIGQVIATLTDRRLEGGAQLSLLYTLTFFVCIPGVYFSV